MQVNQNEEHLRVLSYVHYVLGGLTALMGLVPILHLLLGLGLLTTSLAGQGDPEASVVGVILVAVAGAAILLGVGLGAAQAYAGHCLSHHKNWTFCAVVAAVSCLMIPYGTILGVFTLIVLQRPPVKDLFASRRD